MQPLGAGIIKSFMSQYKKVLAESLINSFEIHEEVKNLNIKDAFCFVIHAWLKVSNKNYCTFP